MNPAPRFGKLFLRQPCIRFTGSPVGQAIAGILLLATLPACGKSAPTPLSAEPKPAVKKTIQHASSSDDLDTVLETVNRDLRREEQALEDQASAIMDANPDMSAKELLNVPEVNTKLADFLKALSKSLELQARVNDSIAFAATMKNLQGNKENWKFAMDLSGYDKARTHRLITSIISGKPERVINFFEHEVTEASAEFSLDPAAPKSTNGIILEKKPDHELPK